MATWGELSVTGWPGRVRLAVKLRNGEGGPPVSGEVEIRIRKRADRNSTRKLGLNDTELIVQVNNTGEWDSGSTPWDWRYWANQGFTTLVAHCGGGIFTYHLDRPVVTQDRTLRATSISGIRILDKKKDPTNPEKMDYVLVWTILDQFGKPIAGAVTRTFDDDIEQVASLSRTVGMCLAKASVEGYGVEKIYAVFPPTGDPVTYTLRGPEKPPPEPTLHTLSDITVSDQPHPTDADKRVYDLYFTGFGTDGKTFSKPNVLRTCSGIPVTYVQGTDEGLVSERIEVTGFGAEYTYTATIPESNHANARRSVVLKGPEKKVETRTKVDPASRFRVGVDTDSITAKHFSAVIPLYTFDEFGVPCESKVEATLVSGRSATFTNARTNAVLDSNVRYCETQTLPDGSCRLGVSFKGQTEIVLEIRHPASGQKRTIRLVYQQR